VAEDKAAVTRRGAPDFAALEARLWAILEPYRDRLVTNSVYGLSTLGWPGAKKHDFFAGVRVAANHVAFHLMPIYHDPSLLTTVSPELRSHLKGKTTWDFSSLDEPRLSELEALTRQAYALYEQRHQSR
jgi:hypothetical protein